MIETLKELQRKYDDLLAKQQLTEAYLLDAVSKLADLSTNSSKELLGQMLKMIKDDDCSDLIETALKSIQNQKDKIYERYGISRQTEGKIE
jgi:hypothetical protein